MGAKLRRFLAKALGESTHLVVKKTTADGRGAPATARALRGRSRGRAGWACMWTDGNAHVVGILLARCARWCDVGGAERRDILDFSRGRGAKGGS